MSVSPIQNTIYTCPLFIRTNENEYINSNNITSIEKGSYNSWDVVSVSNNGYTVKNKICPLEAGKLINISI